MDYIQEIIKIHQRKNATEHTYRAALAKYMEAHMAGCTATNEPKRTKFGAPDYIITRSARSGGKPIPIGYVETKDIGISLDKVETEEQFTRYRKGFTNLILTDYLEFRFYRPGEESRKIRIAELRGDEIVPLPHKYNDLENLFVRFRGFDDEPIGTWQELVERMASTARLMKEDVFKPAFGEDSDSDIKDQLTAFRKILVQDMRAEDFADIYAQTITYGLFTARLHDKTPEDFSREEARTLIPRSNPFLRQLFDYICGANMDSRLVWIVDDLCKIYKSVDIYALKESFGKWTGRNDPLVHFYETFLGKYDPKLRKSRGVWYTPEPVVKFIIRAVDESLKTHFQLADGLAHSGKVMVHIDGEGQKKRKKSIHRVQLLDVATGTGTFMAQVIKEIYQTGFVDQQGAWNNYVEEHLLPRLHGFELLMAPYAMCHLKLDLLLEDTKYHPKNPENPPRLGVYLTNSLEEAHPNHDTLFAKWLSDESNEASRIKRETPVMVAFGNPPYSGHSVNKGKFMDELMMDYKKESTGEKLKERNPKWINDDYVKFIRLAENYIEKKGEGILAYITNHKYLDNATFRGMRWHLLNSFDDIYIFDLHGNSREEKNPPDGSPDKNVFDIRQGVAIIIAVKHGKRKAKLAQVHHADLWGTRQKKYTVLSETRLQDIEWTELKNKSPDYFFSSKNFKGERKYQTGFSMKDLWLSNSVGIVTARDDLTIHDTREQIWDTVKNFVSLSAESARTKYNLGNDVLDWKISLAQEDIKDSGIKQSCLTPMDYRPFDIRHTYYTGTTKGFHCRPRETVMRHFLRGANVGLIVGRQGQVVGSMPWNLVFITNHISDFNLFYRGGGKTHPLYLYEDTRDEEDKGQIENGLNGDSPRKIDKEIEAAMEMWPECTGPAWPNLDRNIVDGIAASLNLPFIPHHEDEKTSDQTAFSPLDLLNYIYAVLHSPSYRETYKEFLKINFPRIPYPQNAKNFWKLAASGSELRLLHLMEHPALTKHITKFPREGNNMVDRPRISKDGRVWINKEQYFEKVPEIAWDFYIGGYQPAQKWLKDRKGRELSYDDINHYQKIITALTETDRLMQKIDAIWKA